MAQIPPPFIDYVLSRDLADGILLAGCVDADCRYRFGAAWTEQRIRRERDPHLRKRIDDRRIALAWTDAYGNDRSIAAQVRALRKALHSLDNKTDPGGLAT
jgi:coenzyme F420-reducing hydrogenase delta subunit